MKFKTEIDIAKSSLSLGYSNRILTLGSCFAHSIGEKLRENKFNIEVNPLGVLFNPLSIASALSRLEECQKVTPEELKLGKEGWFHFDFHSSLSDSDAEQAAAKMNEAVQRGHDSFTSCDTVIITLGTSWVYHLKESGSVVANCHKEPMRAFERRAMRVNEVVDAICDVASRYPDKRFILSVSPVRHLADGLVENSLSKSILRVAISEMTALQPNICYFPAYEILMDDLRDYRFYADDMLHPSKMAIEYIWSKFCATHMSQPTLDTMSSVANIIRAAAHRPFNANSEAHREFCRKQLELIKEHINIDFGKESAYFRSQLQNNL